MPPCGACMILRLPGRPRLSRVEVEYLDLVNGCSMKKWVVAFALFPGLVTPILCAQSGPLTSLAAVHALNNGQAAQHLETDFEATVTYYRDYEQTMFVQDGRCCHLRPAIQSVSAASPATASASTGQPTKASGLSSWATRSPHPPQRPPEPDPVNIRRDHHARRDCQFVSLRGKVLSADIILSSDRRSIALSLLTDGGTAKVIVDSGCAQCVAGLAGRGGAKLPGPSRVCSTARCR